LVARLVRNEKVRGSIPLSSTFFVYFLLQSIILFEANPLMQMIPT
jgi:hypothetical protein